jgi:hypothetical protein
MIRYSLFNKLCKAEVFLSVNLFFRLLSAGLNPEPLNLEPMIPYIRGKK